TFESTTWRLYFHPFGPTKVIDAAPFSTAATGPVIPLCLGAGPPGRASSPMEEVELAVSTGASPGGFSRTMTLLLYVTDTLSPILTSSNRFADWGTSIDTNLPSDVLRLTLREV